MLTTSLQLTTQRLRLDGVNSAREVSSRRAGSTAFRKDVAPNPMWTVSRERSTSSGLAAGEAAARISSGEQVIHQHGGLRQGDQVAARQHIRLDTEPIPR